MLENKFNKIFYIEKQTNAQPIHKKKDYIQNEKH